MYKQLTWFTKLCFFCLFVLNLRPNIAKGSYYFNKHLTSIDKRQEDQTAHTLNRTPEKNDQKRAAQDLKNTSWGDRETREEEKKKKKRSFWGKRCRDQDWSLHPSKGRPGFGKWGRTTTSCPFKAYLNGLRHFQCREFSWPVLHCAALRYQSSVVVLALRGPVVPLWMPPQFFFFPFLSFFGFILKVGLCLLLGIVRRQHFLSSSVQLQRRDGGDVFRKLRFPPHQGPFSALIFLDLCTKDERQSKYRRRRCAQLYCAVI